MVVKVAKAPLVDHHLLLSKQRNDWDVVENICRA